MEIEIFTACDSVQNYNNKIVIVGTFHQVNGNLPIKLPNLGVACSIRFNPAEKIEIKTFEIKFTKGDGTNFAAPIKGSVNYQGGIIETYQVLNICANVTNVSFTDNCTYYIDLLLDEEIVKRFPIYSNITK